MPFGEWFDEYYDDIYKPAIRRAKLKPIRADDLYRPSAIINDIWEMTKRAKVVLADLTGKNPNVFYELGLAHAIGKPAVLVTQAIADVPFDLRALRVIEYDRNDPAWGNELGASVTSALTEVLAAPVTAVLPTFLNGANGANGARRRTRRGNKALVQSLRAEVDSLRTQMRRTEDVARYAPDIAEEIARAIEAGVSPSSVHRRYRDMGMPPELLHRAIDHALTRSRKRGSGIGAKARR